jgi:hypothetical protein
MSDDKPEVPLYRGHPLFSQYGGYAIDHHRSPEEVRRMMQMLIDGPTWRHPISRIKWLRRKRRIAKNIVIVQGSWHSTDHKPMHIRLRMPDGTTKRVLLPEEETDG